MIIEKKYLNPKAYLRKLRQLFAKLAFSFNIPLLVTTKVDNFSIRFATTSYTEYHLRARESYRREEVTMHWLREIIESNDEIIYDIGANVGAYSLYAGQKIRGGKGQVYAFEPAFSNFYPLCRNIEINYLNDTVIPYPIAFGNSRYESRLFLRSTNTGKALHGLSKSESEGKQFDPEFIQGIAVLSLDSFVRSRGVRYPNHIKIDVDGTELAIVEGMTSVLADDRLKSLMIEVDFNLDGDKVEKIVRNNRMKEIMSERMGKQTFNKLYVRQ